MAGTCRIRFVDPPNAAWTTIALRIERSSRMSPSESPACASRTSARAERRAMSSQIGWPEGESAACGTRQPEGLGDDLRRGGGPEELAAAAGAAAGPATELGGLGQRQLAVGEAGPDRLDLAGVLAVAGRQRDAAGDEHRGQMLRPRQGHHHRRQALVAGGDAQHALSPGERSDQPAEDDGRVIAIRQAVHHPGGALGPSVARVGDHPRERHDVQRVAAPRPPRGRAGRSPSGRCGSPGRSGRPSGARRPPCVLRIRKGSRATSLAVHPIPAFWVRPKRSPDGHSLSISPVSGSEPSGPSPAVVTS